MDKTYPIQWRDPRTHLTELAKLRWIEGWSRKRLAKHFGRTERAIQSQFQRLKEQDFKLSGLSEDERRRILWESKK